MHDGSSSESSSLLNLVADVNVSLRNLRPPAPPPVVQSSAARAPSPVPEYVDVDDADASADSVHPSDSASGVSSGAPSGAEDDPVTDATRLRRWAFTLYDPDNDIRKLESCYRPDKSAKLSKVTRFVVYQLEKCPGTGRPHIQGYFEFNKALTFRQVKALFEGAHARVVHISKARTEGVHNIRYCTKERNDDGTPARWSPTTQPYQWGVPSNYGVGEKRDRQPKPFEEVCTLLHAGKNLIDIEGEEALAHLRPTICMHRLRFLATQAAVSSLHSPVLQPIHFEVIYGPPGAGKSHIIVQRWGRSWKKTVYRITSANCTGGTNPQLWWNGYNGQPVVVIDDFNDWLTPTQLLALTEPYECQLPVKGGFVPKMHKHLVVIGNRDPVHWWDMAEFQAKGMRNPACSEVEMASLMSRIKKITPIFDDDHRKREEVPPFPADDPDYHE